MKYCSRCGGGVSQSSGTKFTCNQCGVDHYKNPKAATGIYLIDEDGLLVFAVRARDPHKGGLDCVGGFVDSGETFEQALIRELQEEVGVTEDDLAGITYVAGAYDDYLWQGELEPVGSAYFMARLKKGVELYPADDVASVVRMRITDVNPADFAWEGMRQTWPAFLKLIGSNK